MIVRRVSYFTFMVAITTIATVGSCGLAKAEAQQALLYELSGQEYIAGCGADGDDHTLALARVLQEKGLKAANFKLRTNASGQQEVVSVYLVFHKDYKGQVSAKIFGSKPPCHDAVTIKTGTPLIAGALPVAAALPDQRETIAEKNLILLE